MPKSRMPTPDRPRDDDADQDDGSLFRDAIGPVRTLPPVPLPPPRPKPKPRARMSEIDEAEALRQSRAAGLAPGLEEAFRLGRGDVLSYRRDNVPPRVLRRLARGEYAAQEEIDLHHADATMAERQVRRLIVDARGMGHACVRIVHGKGLNSDDSLPVLKNVVDRVLRQRSDVLAFHSAPAAQGGTGAVLVLLAPR
ncbi:Smr/MutS family protein [Luteimonas vadosa]